MAAGFVALRRIRDRQELGRPGVVVADTTEPGRTNAVPLPAFLSGYFSQEKGIDVTELTGLPPDTRFGRRLYRSLSGDLEAQTSVVLMGRDRTSIHQPDFCLRGVGWDIRRRQMERIAVSRPRPYRLEVQRFDAIQTLTTPDGRPAQRAGVYVFWFVADGQLTSSHWTRTFWMIRDLLTRNVLQRWAYVSYFTVCAPGDEDATFERLSRLIAASVPEFQLATGAAD